MFLLRNKLRVKNLSGNSSEYNVSVEVTKAFGDAKVTVDTTSFTLEDEQLLNVTLEASQANAPAGSELLGYIHITDGVTELSLPFAVDFSAGGAVDGLTEFSIDKTDISFNGDGINDSAKINFATEDIFLTIISKLRISWIRMAGIMEDGSIGYIYADQLLFPGSYTLNFEGQLRTVESSRASIAYSGWSLHI